MKKVCIIVPVGASVLSSIIGPYKVFQTANLFHQRKNPGAPPLFSVHLVGSQPSLELYGGAFQVRPDSHINDAPQADLIVIPALQGDLLEEMRRNRPFVNWIIAQHAGGAEVASLCVGAFLLASTGLVDGKACTTHWAQADQFRKLFPEVNLVSEKVITDESGIYTSGGAFSFLNLLLYMVEKYAGRELAIQLAKYFEVDIDRINQSQFAIFQGQREHEDGPVLQAQTYIESHVSDKLSVEALADMFALSRRNFIRRFKKATSNTPLEYIQRAKVEAAKKALETSSSSVYDVMFKVGYSDSKAFRNLFRKFTGLTPNEYRSKYNRALV